jgi:hypothetical protein
MQSTAGALRIHDDCLNVAVCYTDAKPHVSSRPTAESLVLKLCLHKAHCSTTICIQPAWPAHATADADNTLLCTCCLGLSQVRLLDSIMANNVGTNNWHVAGIGVLRNADVLIQGCTFSNNTAAQRGSSIRVGGVVGSNVKVVNCTFQDNFSACSACVGGAVASFDNATCK